MLKSDTIQSSVVQPVQPVLPPKIASPQSFRSNTQHMSHSDSVFFAPVPQTIAELSVASTDLQSAVSPCQYISQNNQQTQLITSFYTIDAAIDQHLEIKPLGATALSPYAPISVLLTVISLLSIIFVRLSYPNVVSDVMGFVTNSLTWKKFQQTNNIFSKFGISTLNVIFYLVLSALVVEYFLYQNPQLPKHINLLLYTAIIFVFCGILYNLRCLVDKLIGYAFYDDATYATTILFKRASCAVIGLALISFALVLPFVPEAFYQPIFILIACIFVAITTYRIICTMKNRVTDIPSFFYFILYLCTAELAPIVCLYFLIQKLF